MQKRKQEKQYEVEKGQVEFRLLCKQSAIGGLIGTNGNIINSLRLQTRSKIIINKYDPEAKHRVVHVIASYHRTNNVSIDGVVSKLSPAQEALIRVFEVAVESQAASVAFYGRGSGRSGSGVVECVLVVGPVLGNRIDNVCKETDAFVQILPPEIPVPPGANLDDYLVQITGGILPVKKALVAVSEYLQQKVFDRGALEL